MSKKIIIKDILLTLLFLVLEAGAVIMRLITGMNWLSRIAVFIIGVIYTFFAMRRGAGRFVSFMTPVFAVVLQLLLYIHETYILETAKERVILYSVTMLVSNIAVFHILCFAVWNIAKYTRHHRDIK